MSTDAQPVAGPAAPAPRIEPHVLILASALVLTVVAYIGSIRFQFVYDDVLQIVRNPLVHDWSSVGTFFRKHVWAFASPNWAGNYYRPLFLLWLLVNYSLFGLNVVGWHVTSLAMHLLATCMVYRLAARITTDPATGAVAALLFGVHPVHLEAVAWVSGVGDPILAVLAIGAVLAYLNAREQPEHRGRWLAVSLAACALALLDKETGLAVPALIFTTEWLLAEDGAPRGALGRANVGTRDRARAALRAVVPYLAVTLAYIAARSAALSGFAHRDTHTSAATLLLTLPSVVAFYARQLLLPINLGLYYDVEFVLHPTVTNFWVPLLLLIAIAAGLVAWSRHSRAAAFALWWIVLPLGPPLAATIYFVPGELVHDRYLYLPSIGFCILLAMALRVLPRGVRVAGRAVLPSLAVAVLAILGTATTFAQSVYWASNLLLYNRAVQVAPRNPKARDDLAGEMLERGDGPSAIRLYHEAQQLAPDAWEPNYYLGSVYLRLGKLDLAEKYLRQAIAIAPSNPEQHYFLAATLLREGRLDEAEALARFSAGRWPQTPGFHFALGVILERKGNLEAAHDALAQEMRIAPGDEVQAALSRVDTQLAQRK